jgi:hypothetical protein
VQNSFFHHPALLDNDPDNDFQKLQLVPDPHLNLVNLTKAAPLRYLPSCRFFLFNRDCNDLNCIPSRQILQPMQLLTKVSSTYAMPLYLLKYLRTHFWNASR